MLYYTCTVHVNGGEKLPRNKHPEETVQKILDASLKLFLEKGYEQTTVLDIIQQMGGMTRGAFYHHFKTKEEVFDALSDKLFQDQNPFLIAKQQTHLNGLEKFKYIFNTLSFKEHDAQKLSISVMQLLNSPAFLKKLVIETNQETLVPLCQSIMEEGIQDGSIHVKNAKLASELFIMLTNFWTIPTIFPGSEEETWEKVVMIKEILDHMGLPVFDDVYLEGLRGSFEEK